MMNFMDAIENMKCGKCMTRKDWVSFKGVVIVNRENFIWLITDNVSKEPHMNVSIYTPSVEDISAQDWVVKLR